MGYKLKKAKKWRQRATLYIALKQERPILAALYRDVFEKPWLLDAAVKESSANQA